MVVYIIIKNRAKYKKNIEALCNKVGILDYVLLDPEFDDLKRPYPATICLGFKSDDIVSQLKWNTLIPDSSIPVEDKKKIFTVFQQAAEELRDVELKFKKDDMPTSENLKDFLNKYKGQVFELRLKDGRHVGIYPDREKLLGKYPIEYHASTAVNINKIMQIFDPEEIIVKET